MANIRNEPGAPATGGAIPLSVPVLGGNEWAYVKECLDTNWVSSVGPFVDRFEREIAARIGVSQAVAVVNGSAALHLALRLLEIGAGDEVVVPALTFMATLNAVRYTGAVPAILDVDPDYWQLDPAKLADFLENGCECRDDGLFNRLTGRRVRAVMPVHVLGHPCDMDAILAIAGRFGLPVVEDAAEGLGALYKGRPVGSLGLIGCLSFNGNKTITSGGGGMLLTDDPALGKRARYLSTQAKDDDLAYIHNEVGYNYRLTNVLAAIGTAQLERLDDCLAAKKAIAARYAAGLADLPGVSLMQEAPWAESGWWLYTVRIDPARFGMTNMDLLDCLRTQNIQTRPLWQPMHQSPAQAGAFVHRIEHADMIHAQALSLPSSVNLSPFDQDRVIAAIRAAAKAV